MNDLLRQDFNSRLEALYTVFAKYGFRPKMPCCIPHCFDQDDIDALGSKPLRWLQPHDLYRFTLSLLSTCGETEDLKHFLPRLLELTTNSSSGFLDGALVLSKLPQADWHKWPAHERAAVEDFLWAWWRLEVLEDRSIIEETFAALCCTGLEVNSFLRYWRDLDGVNHIISLAQFINRAGTLILAGKSFNGFVGREASRAIQTFMREPETRERFELAFLECSTMKSVHPEHLRSLSLAEQLVQF